MWSSSPAINTPPQSSPFSLFIPIQNPTLSVFSCVQNHPAFNDMSIALNRTGGGGAGGNMIRRSGFGHGCLSMYDSSETKGVDQGHGFERDDDLDSCSSSSSVGRNSDSCDGSSDGEDGSGGAEIQSSVKGPLDTMDQLEEVLPIKKGISKFYNGKSKSFTSLADVSSVSSVKDLAKPKNPYTKKRKNLLAQSHFQARNSTNSLNTTGVELSKRSAANPTRATFLLGESLSTSVSPLPSSCLPPLHPPLHPHSKRSPGNESSPPVPRQNSPWRSFSLSDLQSVAAAPNMTG